MVIACIEHASSMLKTAFTLSTPAAVGTLFTIKFTLSNPVAVETLFATNILPRQISKFFRGACPQIPLENLHLHNMYVI